MTETNADRSRAKRIRRKLDKGAASETDIAWLRAYDDRNRSRRGRKPATSAPRATTVAPDDTGTWIPIDDHEPDDDEDEDEEPASHAPATTDIAPSAKCEIPDCPACAGRLKPGPQICKTTGEPVYPEISMGTARIIAGAFLWAIEWCIGFFYGSDEVPAATSIERDELAKALIEVTRRRFGAIAMVDDLIAPWYPITSYFGRARKAAKAAKAAKALPKPQGEP